MYTTDRRKQEGYIDIHTHILPGVDDGAASMEQSVRMACAAAMDGTAHIILTPHQKADRRSVTPHGILRRMKLLQEEIDKRNIPVRFYPGSEIFYRHGMEGLLEKGQILTLANSRYCLVEFYPEEDYAYIRDGLSRLSDAGCRPILAHAERYVQLTAGEREKELKRQTGCLYQINAPSLTGEAGFPYKSRSRKLLRMGLADFIASDAHGEKERRPQLGRCARWLEKSLGRAQMRRLLTENPSAILEDREL